MRLQQNGYTGLLEPWQVELAYRRARRWGFRGADTEDAVQEVALALLDLDYDPAVWNGRGERYAAGVVIDRRLATLRRCEVRYRSRVQRWMRLDNPSQVEIDPSPDLTEVDLRADIGGVLQELPAVTQCVARGLAAGESFREIALRLQIGWRVVQQESNRIRRHLQRKGLAPVCPPIVEGV